MPNAANQIWPHLKTDQRQPKARAQSNTLADALYPSLSPRQRAWDEARARDKEQLLQGLRELNRKVDERLAREGKR